MKKRSLIFIIINFTCLGTDLTFKLNGGRLGDNITNCLKCLKIAHEFKELNFIPEAFKYYDHFSFEPSNRNYYKTINIKHKDKIEKYLGQKVTLVTDYYFKTDLLEAIKDPTYKKMIQKIFMVNPSMDIDVPDGYYSVAIHIRKGSMGD